MPPEYTDAGIGGTSTGTGENFEEASGGRMTVVDADPEVVVDDRRPVPRLPESREGEAPSRPREGG
ncbi:hypothetical protein [Streptomyces sp. NPDC058695]|uniref:hypothetical protein n=1 Tax=Streptomyces sp. NPDC058695 TaxID=3346604 RepID=UPI00364F1B9A